MPAKCAAPVFERLPHGRFSLSEIESRRGAFSQVTIDAFHPVLSLLDSADDGRRAAAASDCIRETVEFSSKFADAFAEMDRVTAQMVRTGAKPDTVTLLVVDAAGAVVTRPGAY